jgi:ABC-type siderophore export system fused ATPase/permease subunit
MIVAILALILVVALALSIWCASLHDRIRHLETGRDIDNNVANSHGHAIDGIEEMQLVHARRLSDLSDDFTIALLEKKL